MRIEDVYEKMSITLLDEDDVRRVAEYINKNPFLWTGYMTNISIAITYKDYKFICTGYQIHGCPVVIMTADSMKYNYVDKHDLIYSTGNEELDDILRDISYVSPIDENELAWLVEKFYGIDDYEYSEPYEDARSKAIMYNREMEKKYLNGIEQKRIDFFEDKGYTLNYYDL